MTDDERIERLTQLARRVWPDEDAGVVATARGAGVFQPSLDGKAIALILAHPRALDALEKALLVLSGDTPLVAAGQDASAQYGIDPPHVLPVPAWVEQLAADMKCLKEMRVERDALGIESAPDAFAWCIRELRERAKGGER